MMTCSFERRSVLMFISLLFLSSILPQPLRGLSNADAVVEEEEKTLAMIKPDGFRGNYTDKVKRVTLESGFVILKEKVVTLDEDTAAKFYAEHSSRSFFTNLIKYMTSGPVLVMVLQKKNAVADWRVLIGPTDARKAKITHPDSIRAMCGVDSEKNCVHGSDSFQSAQREISFFFEGSSPGTRSACINAASLALADAGIPMSDLVTSCSAGYLNSTPLLDLNYAEDSAGGPDVTVGILPKLNKATLLQMDSKLPTDIFENVMELATEGCKAIANYLREVSGL